MKDETVQYILALMQDDLTAVEQQDLARFTQSAFKEVLEEQANIVNMIDEFTTYIKEHGDIF